MSYTVYKPGQEPTSVANLRREYAAKESVTDAPIRKITLVGADYTPRYMSPDDNLWARCALEVCPMNVAHDFDLTPMNIGLRNGKALPANELNEEEDFLQNPIETDLLLIGKLLKRGPRDLSRFPFMHQFSHIRTSPIASKPNAWRDAAKRSGAKVIVTFAYDPRYDVTIREFADRHYAKGLNFKTQIITGHIIGETLIRKDMLPQKPAPKSCLNLGFLKP